MNGNENEMEYFHFPSSSELKSFREYFHNLLRWVDGSMGDPRGARPPPSLASEILAECAPQVPLYSVTTLRVCHFQVCHLREVGVAEIHKTAKFAKKH